MRSPAADPLGPRHAQVQRLRSLANDRTARRMERAFVAEGVRLIEGIFDRGGEVRALFLDAQPHDPARVASLRARADACGAAVFELAAGVGERIATTVHSQGVFAEVAIPETEFAETLAARSSVLVLVGVQDPGNAGTVLRSAEAAGFGAVVFAADAVDPWNSKVVRASAGAICGVAIVEEKDPVTVLELLGDAGYTRVSTVARAGVAPDVADLTGSVALVIGSEAHGLGPDVVDESDIAVTIPMSGAVESLNAGMAATVLAFEVARQRGWGA